MAGRLINLLFMKKILFIGAHRPDRSPSQRFRFEQYFEYLGHNGFSCKLSNIITEKDDRFLYTSGHYAYKLWVFLKSFFKRLRDVIRSFKYDIVFVQREAFMTGTILFERLFKLSGAKLVFDFDDSIWLKDESPVNNKLNWLKNPSKTSKIIAISDLVIAGNEYLADYARQFSTNVSIIPTTIDTKKYYPHEKKSKTIVVGWSGSFSTVKHFESALPALRILKEKYQNQISYKLIGDGTYRNEELDIKGLPWKEKSEIQELSEIDIGIMPLPDDQWSKGKCGLKGLQYMALGIPTVMSPVGVNSEIIQEGVNGFLAKNTEEWVEKISLLFESNELRKKIGISGRETVEKNYSVEANQQRYLKYLGGLVS